jgi:hypothetical protein
MGFITNVETWAAKCVSDPQWMADCLHRLYRFGGQHPESTVARHSLEVCNLCKHESPTEQLWALIHDAHEILSGEITRGFKARETRERQSLCDEVLREAMGIKGVYLFNVHAADLKHGSIERDQLAEFMSGKISRQQLDSEYLIKWHGTTHEFVFLFEQLKGSI